MKKRILVLMLLLSILLTKTVFAQTTIDAAKPAQLGEINATQFNTQQAETIKEQIKTETKTQNSEEATHDANSEKLNVSSFSELEESAIEQVYKKLSSTKKLTQFGYNFFLQKSKIDWNIPVPDDYILGPGDTLTLYLWGDPIEILNLPGQLELSIDKDGTIFIPNLGKFPIAGLKLKEVQDLLHKSFSTRFKRLSITVSLGKIRGINVYIAGEVNNPGITTVRAISSIIEAISQRGGIKKSGSLRNVVVKRKENGIVKEYKVDFYSLLLKGEPIDFRLKEGDVIYVNPLGDTVGISGYVKRTGIYEIFNGITVKEALEYAGGTLPSAYKYRIQIESFDDEGRKTVKDDISLDQADKVTLKNGDLLIFYPASGIFTNIVEVFGNVEHAGVYEWELNQTLFRLLNRAVVLPDSDLERAFIIRKEVGKQDNIINFSVKDILSRKYDIPLSPLDKVWINKIEPVEGVIVSGEIGQPLKIPFKANLKLSEVVSYAKLHGDAKRLKAEIVRENMDKDPDLATKRTIYLYNLLYKYKSEDDIKLNPGDIVLIKPIIDTESPFTVKIDGEVGKPGVYQFKPGMKVSDIIELAGNLNERGYLKGLIILREGLRKSQEEQLKINILTLEEMLTKSTSAVSAAGDAAEEKALIKMTIEKQKQAIELLKAKAKLMLGRISLNLPNNFEDLKKSAENIELEEGDYIYIPSKPNFVNIMGDVFNQVGVPYRQGEAVSYYLNQVGGVTKTADLENIFVIKANGRVISKQQYSGWFSPRFENITLEPGDAIIVPVEIKVPTMWRPLIKDIVQIIFQSLSTAVLAKRL